MKKNNLKNNKGFTLIETLVAIFILVVAVTGPMSAAQNSLKASFLARDQVAAFYLAQDAIEYIKNYRDANAIAGNSLDQTALYNSAEVGQSSNTWKTFNVDSVNNLIYDHCGTVNPSTSFEEQQCDYMKLDGGIYGYFITGTSGEDSKYKRTIALSDVSDNEYSVVVRVEWDTNLFLTERSITVQENIFDWLSSS